METLSKMEFAALVGVSPSCVSQWIARKKISGDALIGCGCRSRIRVDAARCQLQKNLDIDQRLSANGKANLGAQKPAASVRQASASATMPETTPAAAGGDVLRKKSSRRGSRSLRWRTTRLEQRRRCARVAMSSLKTRGRKQAVLLHAFSL